MMCTECGHHEDIWLMMKNHYRKIHPDINPHSYFTKEAKSK